MADADAKDPLSSPVGCPTDSLGDAVSNSDPAERDPDGMPRRDFLQLGATGLAASFAAPVAGGFASGSNGHRSVAGPAPQQQVGPAPPFLQGRPDPTTVQAETWLEPWTWRPGDWADGSLDLNVIRHQSPGPSPSRGTMSPLLFSFGGTSPGPTIRMRGDETLKIRLRNHMGLNRGIKAVGPYPDPVDVLPTTAAQVCRLAAGMDRDASEEPPFCITFFQVEELREVIPGTFVPSYALNEHTNGPHQAHVTNLHTHGLHVEPERNPDGTHSDDVMLRVIPRADWDARQALDDPDRRRLAEHELVGEAEFTIRLGDVWRSRNGGADPSQPHAPGTHWYHPHPHGATNDQVASGMAGFLIVEGDVDDAINVAMTGDSRPNPEERTGPFDYRERLVFIQKVLLQSLDLDAGPRNRALRQPPVIAVNGIHPPSVLFMRPGAVERWRVLNGSVDGKGTKRFMVLEGEYVETPGQLWRVVRPDPNAGPGAEPGGGGGGGAGGGGGGGGGGAPQQGPPQPTYVPVTRQQIEDAKVSLHMLAMDGITLVTVEGGEARHTIKDLSRVNAGTQNPLASPVRAEDLPFEGPLRNFESCFTDGDAIRRAFNRPNEIYLGNANRADVFFKAPVDSAGKVFTIFAQEDWLHQDNTQQGFQNGIGRLAAGLDPNDPSLFPLFRALAPLDVVAGYVHVRGDPVEGGDFDVQSLSDQLPPVPPYLQPIGEDELRIPAAEAGRVGARTGSFRSRVLAYSGWGAADFPLVTVPESFAREHPEWEGLIWDTWEDTLVLLPPDLRTMGVHGQFDLARHPEPGPAQKFSLDDPTRPILLTETAEEWVVYNTSMPLWGHTDRERFPQPGGYLLHFESYAMSRAEGQRRFWEDPEFQITAKGNDHPFHIHINPCWVTRIDVPDENGVLHNILDEPRWMDSVQVPRAGGRIVFRSRFPDYVGRWIHHCHILAHEDNGMMQIVEATDDASRVNYSPRERVVSHEMPAPEVDAIYPRPSLELCYRHNLCFEDLTPSGYVFPGFDFEVPAPDDD